MTFADTDLDARPEVTRAVALAPDPATPSSDRRRRARRHEIGVVQRELRRMRRELENPIRRTIGG